LLNLLLVPALILVPLFLDRLSVMLQRFSRMLVFFLE
jgi:hypothetical protein